MLYGLDLFSGVGGNSIGLRDYVKTIAYCEADRHAQSVLLSRMADGQINHAPIWDDVATLCAKHFDLPIEIIVGGFPCQDISVAGNGAGLGGKRSGLFFQIMRLAEEIKPKFIFLENVPAIRTRGLDKVVEELTQAGYDCRWGMLSAADVGAPHIRERWFLLANSKDSHDRRELCRLFEESQTVERSEDEHKDTSELVSDSSQDAGVLADTDFERIRSKPCAVRGKQDSGDQAGRDGFVDSSPEVSNSNVSGLERQRQESSGGGSQFDDTCSDSWWEVEPDVGRMVDGVPFRVDRIKRLGNAVVPNQAKEAFERLMGIGRLNYNASVSRHVFYERR